MEPDPNILARHRLLADRPSTSLEALADASLKPDDKTRRLVEQDMAWLDAPEHHLVALGEPRYPAALGEVHDPPPLLFVDGDIEALGAEPRVAVVGARKASTYGLRQGHDLASALAAYPVTVVSGLAIGIDTAAHQGALAAENGRTIAVLGTGCDLIYPKRNWRIAEKIRERGILLSEFPLGTPGYPANFPRRNRIVTGLSAATVVIEAALGSGSLISAALAVSQGRDVMAMPGPVTQPGSRGCHQLIREGAALVENAFDVMCELGLDVENAGVLPSRPTLTPAQQRLYDCLEAGPLSADLLCEATGLPVETLTVSLVSLEIEGLIFSQAGLYQRRLS